MATGRPVMAVPGVGSCHLLGLAWCPRHWGPSLRSSTFACLMWAAPGWRRDAAGPDRVMPLTSGACRSARAVLPGRCKAAVRVLGGRAQLPTLRTSRGVCGAGLRSKGPEGGLLPLPGQGCWPPAGPQLPRPAPTACRTGVRWLQGLEAASAGPPVWLTEGMDRGWGQGAQGGWCSHGQAGWEPGRVVVGCTR